MYPRRSGRATCRSSENGVIMPLGRERNVAEPVKNPPICPICKGRLEASGYAGPADPDTGAAVIGGKRRFRCTNSACGKVFEPEELTSEE